MRGGHQAGRVRPKKAVGVDQVLYELFTRMPAWVPIIPAGLVWLLAWRLLPGSGGHLGAVLAVVILVIGVAAAVERRRRTGLADRQRSLEDLRALSWREFEDVVAVAYRRRGFSAELTAKGMDGGVDLILRWQGQTTLVQCKRWKERKVAVTTVRELYGVMTAEGAHAAVVVSSGRFTAEAVAFAQGKPVTLLDGTGLLLLLADTRVGTESATSAAAPRRAVASNARPPAAHAATTCPRCRKVMVLRTGQFGAFFGCPSYPRCRGTRPATQAIS